MKTSAKILLAASALLAAPVAQAQRLDPFDSHCADIVILQAKEVQKDLGITEAERKQMNVFADRHRAALEQLQKTKTTQQNLQQQVMNLLQQLKNNVLGTLTPAQVRRLREITLQRVGLASLCDPAVAKRLGMSDAQLKRLQSTYQEGARKFAETERATIEPVLAPYKGKTAKTEAEAKRMNAEVQAKLAAVRPKLQPRLEAIRADYNKRMRGILTSSQWNGYNALRGRPFKA